MNITQNKNLYTALDNIVAWTTDALLEFIEVGGSNDVMFPLKEGQDVLWRASTQTSEYGKTTVYLTAYPVLSRTSCGAWIETPYERRKKRWVSDTGYKQFASGDKAKAVKKMYERKQREIRILQSRLAGAEMDMAGLKAHKEQLYGQV